MSTEVEVKDPEDELEVKKAVEATESDELEDAREVSHEWEEFNTNMPLWEHRSEAGAHLDTLSRAWEALAADLLDVVGHVTERFDFEGTATQQEAKGKKQPTAKEGGNLSFHEASTSHTKVAERMHGRKVKSADEMSITDFWHWCKSPGRAALGHPCLEHGGDGRLVVCDLQFAYQQCA